MEARELMISFNGLLRKEVVRFMRIWIQTLVPPAVTTILYFLIFGQVLGSQMGLVQQSTYCEFIAPGLIMLAVINNAYGNVVGSFFGMRFSRAVEELLISPVPNWMIIVGFSAGGVARGMMVGMIVWAISLFFIGYHVAHPFLALFALLLSSALLSLAGFLNAMFAKKFDDTSIIPTFILMPLTYLGGVFYSLDRLSPLWRTIAQFNPLHYIIELFRYAMLGHSGHAWELSLLLVLALVAAMFWLCLYCFNKGYGIKT